MKERGLRPCRLYCSASALSQEFIDRHWDKSWWTNNEFGGSRLHAYPYRYPDHPNAAALRQKVKWNAGSATQDIDCGVSVGCIYNLAAGRIR